MNQTNPYRALTALLLVAGLVVALGLLAGILLDSVTGGLATGIAVAALTVPLFLLWRLRHQPVKPMEQPPQKRVGLALGLVFGIALGIAMSLALDSFAFVGAGLAIGVAVGVALGQRE